MKKSVAHSNPEQHDDSMDVPGGDSSPEPASTEPKLAFVEPKLVKEGKLMEVTKGIGSNYTP